LNYTTEDEARIIVALGVVGSVLAYFALTAQTAAKNGGQGIFPIEKCDPNTPLIPIGYLLIYIVIAFFGVYLVLITLSLGLSVVPSLAEGSEVPKDYADAYFTLGAIVFVVATIVALFYVVHEYDACKTISLVEATPFLLAIGLSMFFASLMAVRKQTGRRVHPPK
jgi:hypothetical protein